ncbi:MAG: DEAD/DEAH box helicase family protein [Candidatus Micrarchaeaceae archaeon]
MNNGKEYEDFIYNLLIKEFKWLFNIKHIPLIKYYKLRPTETFEDLRNQYFSKLNGEVCDRGFDLIGKQNNSYIVIQCKDYKKHVSPNDLGSFFSLFFLCRCRNDKIFGRVYSSHGFTKPFIMEYKNNPYLMLIEQPMNEIPVPEKPYMLREYQINSINQIIDELTKNRICSLVLPCGTGKTEISFEVIKKFNIQVYYFSPLISNVEELYSRYKDKNKSIHHSKRWDENINKVAFVCYKSFDKIKINDDDLVIFDEYHDLNIDVSNLKCKILFISATPKIIYGKKITTISYNEAIESKIINDFRIYIPVLSEWTINRYNQIEFLIQGMELLGKRKCIVYCVNTNHLNELYEMLSCYDVIVEKITQETKNRKQILERFEKEENKKFIILSIKVLDQCINLVKCDSIFITKLTDNKIRTVQRISRSTRYFEGKDKSAIFCYAEEENEILDFLDSLKETDMTIEKKIKPLSLNLNQNYNDFSFKLGMEKQEWEIKVLLGIKQYDKEKCKYELLSKICKLFNFNNEKDPKLKYNLTLEPEKIYIKYWKTWYNFLGINDDLYPKKIEELKIICKNNNIDTVDKYYDFWVQNKNLIPAQPQDYYQEFKNMNNVLFKKFLYKK